jgi:hypothetical protein
MARMILLLCLTLAALELHAAGFQVRTPVADTPEKIALARALTEQRILNSLADELNRRFELPQSLAMGFVECDEPNAYYRPRERSLRVCLELVDYLFDLLGRRFEQGRRLEEAVASAFSFIVLHEVGHALIDLLDLPVTGREEDAADQLAVWLLLVEAGGDRAVVEAAFSFLLADGSQFVDGDPAAYEHALNRQRYYNLVCWVYGSDPQGQAALIEQAALPESRRRSCHAEYLRWHRSWTRLLEGVWRQPQDRLDHSNRG